MSRTRPSPPGWAAFNHPVGKRRPASQRGTPRRPSRRAPPGQAPYPQRRRCGAGLRQPTRRRPTPPTGQPTRLAERRVHTQSAVSRIRRAFGRRPQLLDESKLSPPRPPVHRQGPRRRRPGPESTRCRRRVCVDEETQVQGLDRTARCCRCCRGRPSAAPRLQAQCTTNLSSRPRRRLRRVIADMTAHAIGRGVPQVLEPSSTVASPTA